MKLSTLFDVVCAAHLTCYVKTEFRDRGGMLLAAPPESLKTTVLEVLEFYHPAAVVQTDLTTQQLTRMRDRIAEGHVHTLVLTDFQKLYERNPATAANVEGTIRALVAEGFTAASFEDAEVNRLKAHALVLGAITPAFYHHHAAAWRQTGFIRRFVFPLFVLDDVHALEESVLRGKLLDLGRGVIQPPRNRAIPMDVSEVERRHLADLLKYQEGRTMPLQLMMKVLSVLKWHYASSFARNGHTDKAHKHAMARVEDFAGCLQKGGGRLVVD